MGEPATGQLSVSKEERLAPINRREPFESWKSPPNW
jgi:hypothetical protein